MGLWFCCELHDEFIDEWDESSCELDFMLMSC